MNQLVLEALVCNITDDDFESDSAEKSPKQSLLKVTLGAAVCKCSSK